MAVEGGTRFIKYLLFIFNLLFLLAGLALIIIGAVATAKLTPYSNVAGVQFNGVGVFLIIIGLVVFIISFFGCLGAYKENYCLLIIFVILMVITLLALIAAIITAFVMKDKVNHWISDGFDGMILDYNYTQKESVTKLWDSIQKDLKCCGSNGPPSWLSNGMLKNTSSTPDSCCKNQTVIAHCGTGQAHNGLAVFNDGCADIVSKLIFSNVVAVGGAAVAICILMFIGIVLASCLANGIRKSYQVV